MTDRSHPSRPSCCYLLLWLVALHECTTTTTMVAAFVFPHHSGPASAIAFSETSMGATSDPSSSSPPPLPRRDALSTLLTGATAAATLSLLTTARPHHAFAAEAGQAVQSPEEMYAPKFVQQYDDFTPTPEGWSYRDVTPGSSSAAKANLGDRVVFDWSGYTIGYFGRPFQAKGGPQGGAFDKDVDYERTVLGSGAMVKGLECGLVGTSVGQVRQIVVPLDDKKLSYPADDAKHDRVGPKPSTFSGQRALNFVLENPRIDRTLLFNVKVIRVDKPNGKGGFVRG